MPRLRAGDRSPAGSVTAEPPLRSVRQQWVFARKLASWRCPCPSVVGKVWNHHEANPGGDGELRQIGALNHGENEQAANHYRQTHINYPLRTPKVSVKLLDKTAALPPQTL